MTLVVDASVALKWVLPQPDSPLARALVPSGEELLLPDFWPNEATNICWLQTHKGKWSADEATEALQLLRAQVPPTPTGDLTLHEVALEIGLAVGHSTYDTLYVAFAIAVGARNVLAADGPFVRAMRRRPDPACSFHSKNGRAARVSRERNHAGSPRTKRGRAVDMVTLRSLTVQPMNDESAASLSVVPAATVTRR